MGIIPKEKKAKAGQFFLLLLSGLFFFVAGFYWLDESYTPFQRILGIVGVIIFCCAIIVLGYLGVYYGWFVFVNR